MINKFSIFNEARFFSSGTFCNHLVFISNKKNNKYFNGTRRSNSWNSNEVLEENIENIENITKLDSKFAPAFPDHHLLSDINFNRHLLIKHNTSIPKMVIDL